jgi:AcrR family transcriptional regulator
MLSVVLTARVTHCNSGCPMGRANGGARLDANKILSAALTVADRDGMSAMTLRMVGAELGADPTSIYRHFSSKEALVAAMADRLFGEIVQSDLPVEWRPRFVALMRASRAVYREHPTIIDVLADQPEDSASLRAINEIAVGCLTDAGLEPQQIGLFHQMLAGYVIGAGVLEASWGTASAGTRAAMRRAYSALDPRQFPACVAAAASMFPEADDVFDFAVEILLDAVRAAAPRGRRGRDEPIQRTTSRKK